MKILFLDVDGVLNSQKYFASLGKPFNTTKSDEILDPEAIKLLNTIIKETGAQVVVSSTWRIGSTPFHLQCILQRHGFEGEILDVTPYSSSGIRGREIQEWLNKHPEVTNFVILDDSEDMEHLINKLVRTKYSHGLLEPHAKKIIKLLNS